MDATPDTVLGVAADVADSASMHAQAAAGGSMRMVALEHVEVPANGNAAFVPGGKHVMLTSLRRDYEKGDTIWVEVRLARAGVVSFPAIVLSYAEVAERFAPMPPGNAPHQ